MPTSDFLSVAAVARLLGKDVRTIHRWIERGELPAVKAYEGLRAPYLVTRDAVDVVLAKMNQRRSA